MSALSVRTAFRGAWAAQMPGVPYVETVNVPISDQDMEALPDLWGTFTFTADRNGPVTMGDRPWYEELGTASLMIFGRAGTGDEPASSAAEAAAVAWRSWLDTSGNIWVRSAAGPRPLAESTVGNWLVLTVDLAYSHQFRP